MDHCKYTAVHHCGHCNSGPAPLRARAPCKPPLHRTPHHPMRATAGWNSARPLAPSAVFWTCRNKLQAGEGGCGLRGCWMPTVQFKWQYSRLETGKRARPIQSTVGAIHPSRAVPARYPPDGHHSVAVSACTSTQPCTYPPDASPPLTLLPQCTLYGGDAPSRVSTARHLACEGTNIWAPSLRTRARRSVRQSAHLVSLCSTAIKLLVGTGLGFKIASAYLDTRDDALWPSRNRTSTTSTGILQLRGCPL